MKQQHLLRLSILVFFINIFAVNATIASVPKLTFKENDSNTIVLKVSALRNAIQFVLQDKEGGLLFTEKLDIGYSYRKTYDISSLSEGVYFVKVVEVTNVKFFRIEKGKENKIIEIDKLPFE